MPEKQKVRFGCRTQRESKRIGYRVSIPKLPDTDNPVLTKWLPRALEEKFDEETVLIGHSSWCPLILSILENVKVMVKKAILVAGFSTPLPDGPTKILQKKYDPWGCDDKQGRKKNFRF